MHEDLLALVKHMAPEDGETFTKLIEKNPKLGEGWLRQADYDRGLNKAKADVTAANERAKKWEDWGEENKPRHERLLKDYETLETSSKTKISELETAVKSATEAAAKAASGEGGEVNVEQVNAIVTQEANKLLQSKGFVTNADIERISAETIDKHVKPLIDSAREDFLTKTFPASVQFSADLNEIMADHREEFKEKLDRKAFSTYMQENKLVDPNKAYEMFVSSRRTELQVKQKVEAGVAAELAKRNLPGVSSPGAPEMGPLQIRLNKTADPLNGKDIDLGDNQAAMAAAAEMRAEGKV